MPSALDKLVAQVRRCRVCKDAPKGPALPHEPRPVLRVSSTARIGIFSQAPGTRVHASGMPFTDASGVRLRAWMNVCDDEFYDVTRIAIMPMGFCFPGQDAAGGDLPPRRECAPLWRARLLAELPQLEVVLLVGSHAQNWHLGELQRGSLWETVGDWRAIATTTRTPQMWPLPHPSWRNNHQLKKNPWFEAELLPALRTRIRGLLDEGERASKRRRG